MFAVTSPGSVATLEQSLSTGLSLSSLFTQCHKVVGATAYVALLSICWALGGGVGITTIVAASMGWGSEGVSMDGGC